MKAPEMEIQQEIERTREHLGDTVDELAARADVRTRARAKAAAMKDRAAGAAAQRRWPVVAAAAGAVVIGSVLIRRRRRKA
jgi:hypothetical protein